MEGPTSMTIEYRHWGPTQIANTILHALMYSRRVLQNHIPTLTPFCVPNSGFLGLGLFNLGDPV